MVFIAVLPCNIAFNSCGAVQSHATTLPTLILRFILIRILILPSCYYYHPTHTRTSVLATISQYSRLLSRYDMCCTDITRAYAHPQKKKRKNTAQPREINSKSARFWYKLYGARVDLALTSRRGAGATRAREEAAVVSLLAGEAEKPPVVAEKVRCVALKNKSVHADALACIHPRLQWPAHVSNTTTTPQKTHKIAATPT